MSRIIPFDEIQRKAEEALAWVATRTPVPPSSRFPLYLKKIRRLVDAITENRLAALLEEEEHFEYYVALYEINHLIAIFDGLSTYSGPGLDDALKKVISGQMDYRDEASTAPEINVSSVARDTSFELFLAAKLNQAGYAIDLGHIADIKFEDGGTTYFIECKRPKNDRKADERVKEAVQVQLPKRISETPGTAIGIFAVSIDLIVNSKFNLLTVDSLDSIPKQLLGLVGGFYADHGKYWDRLKTRRVIGGLVSLATPIIVESENRLYFAYNMMPFLFEPHKKAGTRTMVKLTYSANTGSPLTNDANIGGAVVMLSSGKL